jgi:murein DD-endopeptidase MepM/ murein hydrolase activator NlpD
MGTPAVTKLAVVAALAVGVVMTLVVVPLMLFGANAPAADCPGSGSIEGHAVPQGVELAARQAALQSGTDELPLLAVTYRETRWGQADRGLPDDLVLAWLGDLASGVDRAALGAGQPVAVLVDRPQGIRLGDWANPEPVGSEHAIGFAQFLPSTWRRIAAQHPRPASAWDPYSPPDALTLAGYYLGDLLKTTRGDLAAAVQRYGTLGFQSAYDELRKTWRTACAAAISAGDPFGGLCRPRTLQAYGAIEMFTPDGLHHGIDLACDPAAPLFSVTSGVVFDVAAGCQNGARDRCGAGYGNHVVVRFSGRILGDVGDHDYYVIYAHMLTTPQVRRGQEVQPGTDLGLQGDSGLSWGSHLHFEVDRDAWSTLRSVDPSPLLPPSISRTAAP